MKNVFLLLILAAFIFSHCGAQKTPKPEIEPVMVKPPEETKNEVLERIPAEQEQKREQAEEKELAIKPQEPEKIPFIEPEKKPKEIPDSISSGINHIFKEFGYPGDIDVPINFKKRVAYYIRYYSFDKEGSGFFQRSMNRAGEYLPMIGEVFKKKHLPPSLAYLPLVESGFNPDARSRADAVGMWQFIEKTARMYGLKMSRRRDDRKDPLKSTHAAAEYLNDLLAMFGLEDPFLGICAYNAGEGKILNALRKISYKERSFWTLVKKNLLQTETDDYIPRLLAVILMARDPQTYAASSKKVAFEPDDREDQEIIDSIHKTAAAPSEPADATDEPGTKAEPIEKKTTPPSVYVVKRGDSLFSIARKHDMRVKTLKKWNRLRSSRIHPGQKLKLYASAAGSSSNYKLIYTVNYGDSLVRIALFFKGVSVRDIMRWNRLKRSRIYPKQSLAIYLKQPPRKVVTHVVKKGETAGKIARKYGQRLQYVLSLNGLVSNSTLRPGKRLKIYYF
jgi:membrane-bound lytic murein transglycosylase D